MTTETIIGIAALILTLLGIMYKAVGNMKNEIQKSITVQMKVESKLEMINYRLENVEKVVNKLENNFDDLSRYMSSNSDWQVRKH